MLVRRKLEQPGLTDVPAPKRSPAKGNPRRGEKPLMVVVLEWFSERLMKLPKDGIVDALTPGLPDVCKRGPEVFERIDGALFERVGMPSWTTADSIETYVAAAVRMIDQHDERTVLRQRLIDTQAVQRCFEGRPQAFGESVLKLMRTNKSRLADGAALGL